MTSCARTLPDIEETIASPWQGFEQAKAAYDLIVPGRTTRVELHELGFDPGSTPNVTILSYLEILRRFLPNESIRVQDLEEGVRSCIAKQSSCHGYEVAPTYTHSERVGNTLLDILNFKRHTIRTGWAFQALILMEGEVVLYKVWQGQPNIRTEEYRSNPLGPLQDLGGVASGAITPDL